MELNKAEPWGPKRNFFNCNNAASNGSAKGTFCKQGDYLVIRDEARDGLRVGIAWRLSNPKTRKLASARRGICYSLLGNMKGPMGGIGGECNKNFPEGKRVWYRVGTCDGTASKCNRWKHWSDWSAWKSKPTT